MNAQSHGFLFYNIITILWGDHEHAAHAFLATCHLAADYGSHIGIANSHEHTARWISNPLQDSISASVHFTFKDCISSVSSIEPDLNPENSSMPTFLINGKACKISYSDIFLPDKTAREMTLTPPGLQVIVLLQFLGFAINASFQFCVLEGLTFHPL